MDTSYQKLLKGNTHWAKEQLAADEHYFEKLAKGQQPEFLWIGCSDSRVPANEVTNTHAGDIFVHRNIANVVIPSDLNLMSVLQYAVEVLEVKDVILCGHYGCGGVMAAIENKSIGLIDNWIQHVRDVYRKYQDTLEAINDIQERAKKLVELNVAEQVKHLSQTSIIQNAWKKRELRIHGWVYDLASGKLIDLKITRQGTGLIPSDEAHMQAAQ